MAKRKKNSNGKLGVKIKEETRHGVLVVVFFVLALFSILAAFSGAGMVGRYFYKVFAYLFGIGYFLLPVVLILLGVSFIKSARPKIALSHSISSLVFLLSGLGIVDIATENNAGGAIGSLVSIPFVKFFDIYAGILFLGAILIIALLVLFDAKPQFTPFLNRMSLWFAEKIGVVKNIKLRKERDEDEEEYDEDEGVEESEEEDEEDEEEIEDLPAQAGKPSTTDKIKNALGIGGESGIHNIIGEYTPPPLSLLAKDKGKPNVGDIKSNSNIIKRTLKNFGIEVEMDEITIGPSVTRYALKPAEGVKLSKILGLQNDLALALAAHPIRIEAPIPGKSLVGIEIPNKSKSTVGLATMLGDSRFQSDERPLLITLGKGLTGKATFGDLAGMPHLLIAGATGAGKSVTIHTIITSLLYRNGPQDLRFIMIDPKRVELTLYDKIPHLLTPVIKDPKKAILALKWAANEMERRYNLLESHSVRNIQSYHSNIFEEYDGDEENAPERMPYIVIVIDELADIMVAYPRELESAIVRLAQMSRAVGIHLILSTQRPSVNVITGLIKANVPARVALKVSSQIDSRTILDSGGAEKLLGAGDMLFSGGEMSKPQRIQSAFISESEVKKVVKYLSKLFDDELMGDEIELSGSIGTDTSIFNSSIDGDDEEDDLYEEAKDLVIRTGKASTSYLQRKLKIGYSRAARIIDIMEERGTVGPQNGSKPREVLESMDEESFDETQDKEEKYEG